MSDIIIEGKNLSDINQSNFQTVGVRSGFHFITNPNAILSDDESVFKYDVLKVHRTRLGDDYTNVLLPTELLEFVTIEPWQGRLHYDKDFSDITQVNLLNGFSWDDSWQPRNQDAIFKMRIPEFITYPYYQNGVAEMRVSENFIPLYYPYLYTGNIYSTDDIINISSANDITKYKVNDSFGRYNNFLTASFEQRTNDAFIVKDGRFPLGTYTEENKKHWEIQTSDLITRESQFSQTRMQTAQSSKIVESQLIKSEEEEFSVDAFTFTEREGAITPLFFYYDKNLHPIEYNNANTGKINMKVELRESGRNGFNEIDLYQERRVVRPFLMGFEKDEQPNGGTNPLTDELLIGTGTVYGEGLYYADTMITLTSLPDANSYLLGIFDVPDDNLVSTTGNYTFMMPSQDIQYLTKFRPNPYIIMRQRFFDESGDDTVGGPESKGEIRLWQSKLFYDNDEAEYYTVPIDDIPPFTTGGNRIFKDTFRPFDFGGEPITIEQREITTNYKFKGFTYLSGSNNPQDVPFPSEPMQIQTTGPGGTTVMVNADQVYEGFSYDSPGNDESSIKTIKLHEDFRYPNGRLNIYANYGLIMFTLNNLNNQADFENNFADALKYGPFKFVTAKGNSPSIDDYKSTDLSQFTAFAFGDEKVRLLIAGPGMGYANAEYLPSGDNAHLTPIEETGYDLGDFFIEKNYVQIELTETEPDFPPTGFTPDNLMIGTLSPLEQWKWDGAQWNGVILVEDQLLIENPIPLRIDIPKQLSNTMANAIELNGGSSPTPTTVQGDEPVTVNGIIFYDTQPSNYSVGTLDSTGLFKVTSVDYLSTNNLGGVYGLTWGPNITNQTRNVNKFRLDENERDDYKGVLLGDTLSVESFEDAVEHNGGPLNDQISFPKDPQTGGSLPLPGPGVFPNSDQEYDYSAGTVHGLDDVFIVESVTISTGTYTDTLNITWGVNPNTDAIGGLTSNEINQIITTETTSSISYQPLQNGTYIKSRDLGANTSLTTAIVESETSISGRVRSKEDSGAIDANMYGFGQTYRVTMTPSEESLPPEIDVFLAQENGDLALSSNLYTGLTKSTLGVEWNPDDWSPNGGGSFSYTVPESRDAFLTINGVNVPLYWKYIEFRIQTLQTAEGEQSENNEPVDPNFYVGLNVFGMPGAGGQIFNDFDQTQEPVLVSTGGLQNLFNIEEMVDENGIPYQEFSQIPDGLRTIVLRAVPSSGGFADANSVGTWSFMADPGVNVDTVGSIQQFWVGDPEDDNFQHHLGIITFNQEGPVTVRYQWFGDGSGGGP